MHYACTLATLPQNYTSIARRIPAQELPQLIQPTAMALTTAWTSARASPVELETALRAPVPRLLPAWAGGCAPPAWAHAGAYPLGWAAGSSAQLHDRQGGMHAGAGRCRCMRREIACCLLAQGPMTMAGQRGTWRLQTCMVVTKVSMGAEKGSACSGAA